MLEGYIFYYQENTYSLIWTFKRFQLYQLEKMNLVVYINLRTFKNIVKLFNQTQIFHYKHPSLSSC